MHHLRTTLAAAASIAVLGLAGCSSSGSTETPSTPPETTGSAPTSETNAGPEIDNPKNLANVKDGCQLLKPNQAQQLGAGTSPQPRDSEVGPSCNWEQGETSLSLTAATGVGGFFGGKPEGRTDGYPFLTKTSNEIVCGRRFATSNQQTLVVTVTTDFGSPTPPCDLANQAAGMAISNLPPAN